eukprot:6078536-Pyramimonas_sp.AAC.1
MAVSAVYRDFALAAEIQDLRGHREERRQALDRANSPTTSRANRDYVQSDGAGQETGRLQSGRGHFRPGSG